AELRTGGKAGRMGYVVADSRRTDIAIELFPCGNGNLEQGEQCDVTAPNGDLACPGMCVPPGQPNECTCTPATTTTSTTTTTSSTTSTTTSSTTSTTETTTTTTTLAVTTITELTPPTTTTAPTTTT